MYPVSQYTTSTESIIAADMVSKFEDSLLRCKRDDGAFRKKLFQYLDDGGSTLRSLRTVSRVLLDLVDHHPGRMFRMLYVDAPIRSSKSTRSLETLAPLCYSLTIKVGYAEHYSNSRNNSSASASTRLSDEFVRRSQDLMQTFMGQKKWPRSNSKRGSLQSHRQSIESTRTKFRASMPPGQLPITERKQQHDARELWTGLLSRFRQLRSLTLRVNGDPAWPGRTDVEDMLVTLRIAVEQANLLELRTLCLGPVHAMGIIHLRWLGVGAFAGAQASAANVWLNIQTLDLWIHSPFGSRKLTPPQETMFKKILYEYLRSCAPSIRCLRLVWLGDAGPGPLNLHLDQQLKDRPAIKWPKLEELWVGNIVEPGRMIELTHEFAPSVSCLKILHSRHRDSSMDDLSDSSAWIEVRGLPESAEYGRTNRASSIYSQSALSEESAWVGGISRSSRDLQFWLDISDST